MRGPATGRSRCRLWTQAAGVRGQAWRKLPSRATGSHSQVDSEAPPHLLAAHLLPGRAPACQRTRGPPGPAVPGTAGRRAGGTAAPVTAGTPGPVRRRPSRGARLSRAAGAGRPTGFLGWLSQEQPDEGLQVTRRPPPQQSELEPRPLGKARGQDSGRVSPGFKRLLLWFLSSRLKSSRR